MRISHRMTAEGLTARSVRRDKPPELMSLTVPRMRPLRTFEGPNEGSSWALISQENG